MILTALAVLILSDQPIATARSDDGHVSAEPAVRQPITPAITGPRTMTTDQQIAAWIGASPAGPAEAGDEPLDYDAPFQTERRVRGSVSAAVGSHDYQAFGVDVSVPVGESGFVSLHYSESKGGLSGYSSYYGPRYGAYDVGRTLSIGALDARNVHGPDDRRW